MKKKKERFYLCTCNRLTQVNDDVLARELEKKFNLKTGLLEYEKKMKTFYNKLFDITLSDEEKEISEKYYKTRDEIMSRCIHEREIKRVDIVQLFFIMFFYFTIIL